MREWDSVSLTYPVPNNGRKHVAPRLIVFRGPHSFRCTLGDTSIMSNRAMLFIFALLAFVVAPAPFAEPQYADDRRLVSDALARHFDGAIPATIGAGELVVVEPLTAASRNRLVDDAVVDVIVGRGGRVSMVGTDESAWRVRYAVTELVVMAEETGTRLIRTHRLVRAVRGVVLLEIVAPAGNVVGAETVVVRSEAVTPRVGTRDLRHADIERRVVERSRPSFQYVALAALLLTFALTVR